MTGLFRSNHIDIEAKEATANRSRGYERYVVTAFSNRRTIHYLQLRANYLINSRWLLLAKVQLLTPSDDPFILRYQSSWFESWMARFYPFWTRRLNPG